MDKYTKIALVLVVAIAGVVAIGNLPGLRPARQGRTDGPKGPVNVLHLTASEFPALKAQDKPVLMDFWAPWCGPCRTQGPIVEEVASLVGERAVVAKVNVDDEKALASQYGVRAIPTLIVMKKGKEVRRFVGVTSAATLIGSVDFD